MHYALYRSERPETFSEMIGQKHIVKILQNQLRNGTVSQAYLFTGIRGTGKTTTARILAKALNCTGDTEDKPCGQCQNCQAIRDGKFMDVVELDAASNNGVDDIRSLIDSVYYPPVIGKYKVYIIDEVHMLSASAENAFLKTLEEPPEYAVFILATTDPEKVRPTIRSRCMTLNFKRVSEDELAEGMSRICRKKEVNVTEPALRLIARSADGSVRDALSILEQCISAGDDPVTEELVLEYTGAAGRDFYLDLTDRIIDQDAAGALEAIQAMAAAGADPKVMISDLMGHYRDLMVVKVAKKPEVMVKVSPENMERLRDQAGRMELSQITGGIRTLTDFVDLARYSTKTGILLDTAAVQLIEGPAACCGGQAPQQGQPVQPPRSSRPVKPEIVPVSTRKKRASRSESPAESPAAGREEPPAPRKAARKPGNGPTGDTVAAGQPLGDKPEARQNGEQKPAVDQAAMHGTAEHQPDVKKMWNFIRTQMESREPSNHMIFSNLELTAVVDGEVMISALKTRSLKLAANKKDEIEELVRSRFGKNYYVTLRPKEDNMRIAASMGVSASSQAAGASGGQERNAGRKAEAGRGPSPVSAPEPSAETARDTGSAAETQRGQDARERPEPQGRPWSGEMPGEQYEPEPPFSGDEDYEDSIPPADYVPPEVESMAPVAAESAQEQPEGADDEPLSEDDAIAALIKSKIGDVPFTIE